MSIQLRGWACRAFTCALWCSVASCGSNGGGDATGGAGGSQSSGGDGGVGGQGGVGSSSGGSNSTSGTCAELARCCEHASAELKQTCELSLDLNDPVNCAAGIMYLQNMGVCSGGSPDGNGGAPGTGGSQSATSGGAFAGGTGNIDQGGVAGASSIQTVDYSWNIRLFTPEGELNSCSDVSAVNFSLLGRRRQGGRSFYFTSACSAMKARAQNLGLPPGTYDYDAELEASGGSAFGKVSGTFELPSGATSFVIPTIGLVFHRGPVAWNIERGGAPVTCVDAGASTFEVSAVRDQTWRQQAACEGKTLTLMLPAGTFQFSAKLLASGGSEIAGWTNSASVILPNDKAAAFPQVTFVLPP